MIYVTGDTHGEYDFDKIQRFIIDNPNLTSDDFLIIAGDFGAVWSKETLAQSLKLYMNLPCTILFIDGNHENFDLLDAMPIQMWNGGKVHRVADNIIHLMRGQVFTIEGKTFFTFGGAESIDKSSRMPGVSWWPQEVPNFNEYEEAYKNLEAVGMKVDYIITHTIDEKALCSPAFYKYRFKPFATNRALLNFEEEINYGHWYFGHYHIDAVLSDKKTALYYDIIKL